ncbi:efflux RND transporter periplasmic adaptor subunit [Sulfurimonas sp.]
MNKIVMSLLGLGVMLSGVEIPLERATIHEFKKSVAINAKVIQLSNAQQSITSLVQGHLEKYFVKPAQNVKAGDKIALLESIEVSKMSADYISLKKQYEVVSKNYEAIKSLYEKGMASMQSLNTQAIKKSAIAANLNALKSQLKALSIDAQRLESATSNFILYAHSEGKVSELLKPLHSSVSINEAIVKLLKNQAYYVKSYLPLEYATKVRVGDKLTILYNNKIITTHISQIMPKVDAVTQRAVVLSSVDEKVENLFIDVYVEAKIYFGRAYRGIAVKKSALSFFNNEWVVFIPKEQEHNDEHEAAYTAKVVEIVGSDEQYVAVKGMELGEEYVSAKSYYVKSQLLKSSLGEHGH